MATHYDLIQSNKIRSIAIITAFILAVLGLTYLLVWSELAPLSVIAGVFIITGIWSLISYFFSDRIILLYSGAHLAGREEYFDFYTVAENIALVAQTPLPKIYVIDDVAPNAFATGRDPEHAVICATTGLLKMLDRHELEAVVAHEMSHVRHYDILLASLIAILVGTLVIVIDLILRGFARVKGSDGGSSAVAGARLFVYMLAIIAPFLLRLAQLAISRRREFFADAGSVELTQNPQALVSALKKISSDQHQLTRVSSATASLYIADPIKKKNFLQKLNNAFSTHPPVEKRIAALEELMILKEG